MSQSVAVIVAGVIVAASILVDGYLERRAEVDRIDMCIDIAMANMGYRGGPGSGGEERTQHWIECTQSVR